MKDPYSTLFYKVKFTIEARDPETDLLWKVVKHIKDWMTKKYNTKDVVLTTDNHEWTALIQNSGGVLQSANYEVRVRSENCYVDELEGTSYWACEIVESPRSETEFAPRQWVTEIGFKPTSSTQAVFSCVISYQDRAGFIGEYDEMPAPNIPRIIKKIWGDKDFKCEIGIDQPSVVPERIGSADWVAFWDRLKSEKRSIPYIYISPVNRAGLGEQSILIDPDQLAVATGGNAKVFYSLSTSETEEMNSIIPEEYTCYDGSVRVYFPNLKEETAGDSRRHRYFPSIYIREAGDNHITSIIRRAIAQAAIFDSDYFRVDDCRKMREDIVRKRRLDELKQKHFEEIARRDSEHSEELKETEESILEIASDAEERRLIAEDKAEMLEEEKNQLEDEIYRLKVENESYISLSKENSELRKTVAFRGDCKEYPEDVFGVVSFFKGFFSDRIAFSDEAEKSLKGCSIPLDKLWKALYSLATTMVDLYNDGSGDIFAEFRVKTGIEIARGEGTMTRSDKKLMRQFEIIYQGEKISIEPHITYPELKQSIHFGFFRGEKKIVVGSCGEHKKIYSSRKTH